VFIGLAAIQRERGRSKTQKTYFLNTKTLNSIL